LSSKVVQWRKLLCRGGARFKLHLTLEDKTPLLAFHWYYVVCVILYEQWERYIDTQEAGKNQSGRIGCFKWWREQ
jgi:hypothetical protein